LALIKTGLPTIVGSSDGAGWESGSGELKTVAVILGLFQEDAPADIGNAGGTTEVPVVRPRQRRRASPTLCCYRFPSEPEAPQFWIRIKLREPPRRVKHCRWRHHRAVASN
jgi:hypothetical protein